MAARVRADRSRRKSRRMDGPRGRWPRRIHGPVEATILEHRILLSGGVDSSLLALKAKQAGFRNCVALTARWPGENPELELAIAIAKHIGIEHHVVDVDESKFERSCRGSCGGSRSCRGTSIPWCWPACSSTRARGSRRSCTGIPPTSCSAPPDAVAISAFKRRRRILARHSAAAAAAAGRALPYNGARGCRRLRQYLELDEHGFLKSQFAIEYGKAGARQGPCISARADRACGRSRSSTRSAIRPSSECSASTHIRSTRATSRCWTGLSAPFGVHRHDAVPVARNDGHCARAAIRTQGDGHAHEARAQAAHGAVVPARMGVPRRNRDFRPTRPAGSRSRSPAGARCWPRSAPARAGCCPCGASGRRTSGRTTRLSGARSASRSSAGSSWTATAAPIRRQIERLPPLIDSLVAGPNSDFQNTTGPTPLAARRASVRGRVQGVWFRASTAERATALGLRGRAENRPDGSVLVHAAGAPAALDALIAWLHVGPPMARVDAGRGGSRSTPRRWSGRLDSSAVRKRGRSEKGTLTFFRRDAHHPKKVSVPFS